MNVLCGFCTFLQEFPKPVLSLSLRQPYRTTISHYIHASSAYHIGSRLMDTYLVHPPVLVLANDTGERWIYFLCTNPFSTHFRSSKVMNFFHTKLLCFLFHFLLPDLVLVELQVLKDDAFVPVFGITNDLLDQTTNIIISLVCAGIQDTVVDECLGRYQVAIGTTSAIAIRSGLHPLQSHHSRILHLASGWFNLVVNHGLEVLVILPLEPDIVCLARR